MINIFIAIKTTEIFSDSFHAYFPALGLKDISLS